MSRERPDGYNWAAALLCITGIGLVSLTEGFTMRFGDIFTLIGGFFYAAHMIAVARFGRKKDPFLLTIVQFGSAGVCSWIAGLCFETIPSSLSTDSLLGLLFLAVFASAGALLLQNVGQKGTSPPPPPSSSAWNRCLACSSPCSSTARPLPPRCSASPHLRRRHHLRNQTLLPAPEQTAHE